MPIYEYACQACGERHEAIQKHTDAALTDCPACGKPKLEKIMSSTNFQLKGGGWYVTDFKDKPAGKSSEPAAKEAVASTTKETTVADKSADAKSTVKSEEATTAKSVSKDSDK